MNRDMARAAAEALEERVLTGDLVWTSDDGARCYERRDGDDYRLTIIGPGGARLVCEYAGIARDGLAGFASTPPHRVQVDASAPAPSDAGGSAIDKLRRLLAETRENLAGSDQALASVSRQPADQGHAGPHLISTQAEDAP